MSNEIKPSKKLPSYLKKIESGGLLIGFIYVLVFMSILALIISQITQSTNFNNTLSAIDERVLIIEEQINIADETNNDSLTEISSSIQFLDREVRKLWDLSNKKNRVDISKIKKTIDDINENLQNLNLNMGRAAKNIKGNKDLVDKIERQLGNISSIGKNLTELQSSIRSLETQIIIIDDSIVSLENYKKQLNQVINEVQTEIVSIKESIIKE
jgi:chromosome segregation ATPase